MSKRTFLVTQKVVARLGICLLGTAAILTPLTNAAYAAPVIIRGIESAPASTEPRLAYLASFPSGSFDPSLDKLGAGPLVPGDPLIPNTNPTYSFVPGAILVGVSRPVGLDPSLFPAESVFATSLHFGPGSVSRYRATFRAPVGPLPGGGFAIGLIARTGGKDDLDPDTKVGATVNVRPGFLVRFGASFGNVDPARVVLPQDVKDAIFSTTDPQPFTIDLTVDRVHGTATAKLTVIDQVFTVPFVLSDFRADSGPVITAAGPGIAVNSNAPGQTASVQIREFRIYANGGE